MRIFIHEVTERAQQHINNDRAFIASATQRAVPTAEWPWSADADGRGWCKMVDAHIHINKKKLFSCLRRVPPATWGQAIFARNIPQQYHEKMTENDQKGLWDSFVWEQRDERLDDLPLMNSLWPTGKDSCGICKVTFLLKLITLMPGILGTV